MGLIFKLSLLLLLLFFNGQLFHFIYKYFLAISLHHHVFSRIWCFVWFSMQKILNSKQNEKKEDKKKRKRNKTEWWLHWPLQLSEHATSSLEWPWHGIPSNAGAGFVHVLDRVLIPPQVLEHTVYGVHSDQLPCTGLGTAKEGDLTRGLTRG